VPESTDECNELSARGNPGGGSARSGLSGSGIGARKASKKTTPATTKTKKKGGRMGGVISGQVVKKKKRRVNQSGKSIHVHL
jgi:hypothetical protein